MTNAGFIVDGSNINTFKLHISLPILTDQAVRAKRFPIDLHLANQPRLVR